MIPPGYNIIYLFATIRCPQVQFSILSTLSPKYNIMVDFLFMVRCHSGAIYFLYFPQYGVCKVQYGIFVLHIVVSAKCNIIYLFAVWCPLSAIWLLLALRELTTPWTHSMAVQRETDGVTSRSRDKSHDHTHESSIDIIYISGVSL